MSDVEESSFGQRHCRINQESGFVPTQYGAMYLRRVPNVLWQSLGGNGDQTDIQQVSRSAAQYIEVQRVQSAHEFGAGTDGDREGSPHPEYELLLSLGRRHVSGASNLSGRGVRYDSCASVLWF